MAAVISTNLRYRSRSECHDDRRSGIATYWPLFGTARHDAHFNEVRPLYAHDTHAMPSSIFPSIDADIVKPYTI
jgi:hypothetical protein